MRNDSLIGDYAVNLDGAVGFTGPVLNMAGATSLGIHVYSVGATNMTLVVQSSNFDGIKVPLPAGVPWSGTGGGFANLGTNANQFIAYPLALFSINNQPVHAAYVRLVFVPNSGSVGRYWCAVNIRRGTE